jgi:hypothetical protein
MSKTINNNKAMLAKIDNLTKIVESTTLLPKRVSKKRRRRSIVDVFETRVSWRR